MSSQRDLPAMRIVIPDPAALLELKTETTEHKSVRDVHFLVRYDGENIPFNVLMELGQLVVMGQEAPANLVVFIVDNGVYESIGSTKGVPRATATSGKTDLAALAKGAGVPYAVNVETAEQLEKEMELAFSQQGCRFTDGKLPFTERDQAECRHHQRYLGECGAQRHLVGPARRQLFRKREFGTKHFIRQEQDLVSPIR